jgi:uncharacterized alpha-E superfamily protein
MSPATRLAVRRVRTAAQAETWHVIAKLARDLADHTAHRSAEAADRHALVMTEDGWDRVRMLPMRAALMRSPLNHPPAS